LRHSRSHAPAQSYGALLVGIFVQGAAELTGGEGKPLSARDDPRRLTLKWLFCVKNGMPAFALFVDALGYRD
jgi:hypothetical protein